MNETLKKVRAELRVPKNEWNDYGKYHYRNLEGILEVAKPILEKHDAELIITDSIVYVEGRWYVKATATFESAEGLVVVNGWARESESKKGMDDAQITGSASSYARKYALNGLFLLDDNKDSDTNEYKKEIDERAKSPKVSEDAIRSLEKFAKSVGVSTNAICGRFGIKDLSEMTQDDYVSAMKSLEKTAEKNEEENRKNERNSKKG